MSLCTKSADHWSKKKDASIHKYMVNILNLNYDNVNLEIIIGSYTNKNISISQKEYEQSEWNWSSETKKINLASKHEKKKIWTPLGLKHRSKTLMTDCSPLQNII